MMAKLHDRNSFCIQLAAVFRQPFWQMLLALVRRVSAKVMQDTPVGAHNDADNGRLVDRRVPPGINDAWLVDAARRQLGLDVARVDQHAIRSDAK